MPDSRCDPATGPNLYGVLGIDAALDGVTAHLHLRCVNGSFAGGDADLHLHDTDAGDHLGHRMLPCTRVFISMK